MPITLPTSGDTGTANLLLCHTRSAAPTARDFWLTNAFVAGADSQASAMSPILNRESLPPEVQQYAQFHNRLASFIDWPVKWEQERLKPFPEEFARAGFYSYASPPNLPDNVACPFCELFLDKWEPGDNPREEHEKRAPDCSFIQAEKARDNRSGSSNLTPHRPTSLSRPAVQGAKIEKKKAKKKKRRTQP